MNRLLFVDSRTFAAGGEPRWRHALSKACETAGIALRVGEVHSRGRLNSPDIVGIAGLAASVVGVALGLINLFQRPKAEQTASVLRSEIATVFEKHEQKTQRITRVNGFDSIAAGIISGEILIEENQSEQHVHVIVTKDVVVVSPFEIDSRLY